MDKLKSAIQQVPIVVLPDFIEEFVVETNASGIGVGVLLSQRGKPIAFYSHAIVGRARYKSVYERELMAIILAIQKWCHYLLGGYFVVRTDQKSLKCLFEQHIMAMEYQQWITKLMGSDFELQYKPRLENKAADALS